MPAYSEDVESGERTKLFHNKKEKQKHEKYFNEEARARAAAEYKSRSTLGKVGKFISQGVSGLAIALKQRRATSKAAASPQFRRKLTNLLPHPQHVSNRRLRRGARTRRAHAVYPNQSYIPRQVVRQFNPEVRPFTYHQALVLESQQLPRGYYYDTDMITGLKVIKKRRLG